MERVLTVGIYRQENKRAHNVCRAMVEGIVSTGDHTIIYSSKVPTEALHDIAVFYGLSNGNLATMQRYLKAHRHTVYIDLGYWKRHTPNRLNGYHRLVVDGLHPSVQMSFSKVKDRFKDLNIPINDIRSQDGHILVAGMSAKASAVYGLRPEEWERDIIGVLKRFTSRTIVYRSKPSWDGSTRIAGTVHDDGSQGIDESLNNTYSVVTHHSNVAIDALMKGIPSYCPYSPIHSFMNALNPTLLGDLPIDSKRRIKGIGHALAYVQWNVAEMASGEAWRHLREQYLWT